MCCDERVYIRHGAEPACCGMRAYDASTHICCIEYVWPKMGENPSCCGNQLYDSKLHDCSPDGQLSMKMDQRVDNKGNEHPMLMKPTDATLSPDDNYYIDKDYETDQNEFPDFFMTHGSGIGGQGNEVRPIVYKTRPSNPTTEAPEYLTDLPEDFWEGFQRHVNRKNDKQTQVLTPRTSPPPVPTTITDTVLTSIFSPVETTVPAEPQRSSSTKQDLYFPKGPEDFVTGGSIKQKTLASKRSTYFSSKYVTFPVDTGGRFTFPPLLPAKRDPPKATQKACCQTNGLTLYQCCLHTVNNSVNSLLPPCCSGFVVKVCCWTGENDYSCCSRQEDCCHPEKLYRNVRKKPTDWLKYRTNLDKKAALVPVIRPQKTEVNEVRTRSRKCCRLSKRPSCCVRFDKRLSCCSQNRQAAPPDVTPPWNLRVRTTVLKNTTPQTTIASTTGMQSTNRNRCCATSSFRPTCCSTVLIRPHCCFREPTRKVPLPGPSQRRQLQAGQQSQSTLQKRNCQCFGRSCCNSRRWSRQCCRTKAVHSAAKRPQIPQAEQPHGSGASCCDSGDPSTCCWVLYVKILRVPACCENRLYFGNNNQPKPLCPGKSYDPVKEICCQGQKHTKKGVRPRCCGQKAYDAYLNYCCQGRISETC